MAKFFLYVFAAGVSLGGVACDFLCILQQLMVVTPDNFFNSPVSSCQDVESKFDNLRKGLKKCTLHEINTEDLKSLHKDFCTPFSDFRRNFNRHQWCLTRNVPNANDCVDNASFSHTEVLESGIKDACIKLSEDTTNCMNDKIGKPCGDGGLKVYQRITEASKPFFTVICLEAAGIRTVGNELEEYDSSVTETGVVGAGLAEAAAAEGASAEAEYVISAGSVANSTLVCIMLLGVLLAVKWYR